MAKIGVYVPDDRMQDIERWRESMNFSQLFLEAFDRAIAMQADLDKVQGKEMKTLVERLKRESGKTFEAGWKCGAKQGRQWAIHSAHLSHLREIGEGRRFAGPAQDVSGFLRFHYEWAGYFTTPEEEHQRMDDERVDDMVIWDCGYNRGFVESVQQVWAEIRDSF